MKLCPDENGKCGYEECRDDRHGSIGSCYDQGWHGLDCPRRESSVACDAPPKPVVSKPTRDTVHKMVEFALMGVYGGRHSPADAEEMVVQTMREYLLAVGWAVEDKPI